MIPVTRLNGKQIYINAILIESLEETPDTVITLTNGKKIMVLEKNQEVVSLVETYMRSIGSIQGTIKSVDSEGT
ncbi:flagellar FlbD family protein [Paenibacillus aurantius]|uniref:Flagellar FlbD family protein n=1 Tax=Paenibacillus aurantius TaxID=2918900 RepID=A0AA96LIA1_9BACL|nr:flagellar FlbD family protein [Paenibacillus aurantius]WJH33273.1 flagellar FlbD family protein [Paenibacillus sp. CC-CFT747]WNQ13740.1 flagellar FlbD family protein [Paenibacillus aurantius]